MSLWTKQVKWALATGRGNGMGIGDAVGKMTAAVICTARSARVNQVRHAITRALANQARMIRLPVPRRTVVGPLRQGAGAADPGTRPRADGGRDGLGAQHDRGRST